MWKKPAGARILLAGLLAACALPALASDLGVQAVFVAPGITIQSQSGLPNSGVLWESGGSKQITEPWDTVLFQGISPDPAVTFEVSRQPPGGTWTPWESAPVNRHAGGRFWGKYAFPFAGPGAIRLRAVTAGTPSTQKIEVLGVEVFDSSAVSAQKPVPPLMLEVGGGTRPVVIGRESWRAKPPQEPYEPLLPYRITLHHTSGIQPMSMADAEAELRFIQDFHQNGRGWSDIAYHFLIDGAGRIYEGRPEIVEGSHTLHNNEGNIGIALMGNHQPPKNDPVTPAERDALVRLGQYLVQHYGIDPTSLKGHRDYRRTECPGDIAYKLIPVLRKQFAQEKLLAKKRLKAKTPPKIASSKPSFDGRP